MRCSGILVPGVYSAGPISNSFATVVKDHGPRNSRSVRGRRLDLSRHRKLKGRRIDGASRLRWQHAVAPGDCPLPAGEDHGCHSGLFTIAGGRLVAWVSRQGYLSLRNDDSIALGSACRRVYFAVIAVVVWILCAILIGPAEFT